MSTVTAKKRCSFNIMLIAGLSVYTFLAIWLDKQKEPLIRVNSNPGLLKRQVAVCGAAAIGNINRAKETQLFQAKK